jgi:broad specificity phosphatase PhoE
MTKVLLTRHGHVEGIRPARFRGRAELALTDQGVAQADALARRIADGWKAAAVYTSPMQRCVVTGDQDRVGLRYQGRGAVRLTRSRLWGWQMRTHEEVHAEIPEAYAQWRSAPQLTRFPGGESLQDVAARSADMLRELLDRHRDETVVLVGHDSVTGCCCWGCSACPCRPTGGWSRIPCTLNEVEVFAAGEVRVQRINDTSHLDRA